MSRYLYSLKLLSGPLNGQVLSMQEGEIVIGNGDADIVVPLQSGNLAHLIINIDGVFLKPGVPCWMDGNPVEREELNQTKLLQNCVIDLDGLLFVLCEYGKEFPKLRLPERRDRRRELRNVVLLGGGILFLLFTAFLAMFWIQNYLVSLKTPAINGNGYAKEKLALQQRKPAFKQLEFKWAADQVLDVTGSCEDSSQLDTMLNTLRQDAVLIRNQAICNDQLLSQVLSLLRLHGYNEVNVLPGESLNAVHIEGAIGSDENWDTVVQSLKRVPGLHSWTVRNDVSDVVRRLALRLQQEQLGEGMNISRINDTLIVSALLDDGRERKVREVLSQFIKPSAGKMKAIFQNIPSTVDVGQFLSAPVQSLGGSTLSPYLELSNGLRIQQGSYLPNGYEVISLSSKGINLLSNERAVFIPLNW